MSFTSDYYKANPEAAAKHRAYQKKYNAKPENIKSRAEDNKARKDLDIPVGSKMDASRKTRIGKNGKLITYFVREDRSENRGKTGNSKDAQPGDKRSRPGSSSKKNKE